MRFASASGGGAVGGTVLAWWLLAVTTATAGEPATASPTAPGALSLERLACMDWCDLEKLYRQAGPGTIPAGYACGRAIYCPGALLSPARSKITQALWHGKLFCPDDGTLINQWCLGLHAIRARVYYDLSWLDSKPSIVMDYRGMSHIWGDVRDEVREVAPGLYLGIMYRCKTRQPHRKMFFALELAPSCRPGNEMSFHP
jgi:hypothetical protein